MNDKIKVAICESLIAINSEDPIIPPTAIDWIGNRLTFAVVEALDDAGAAHALTGGDDE